MDKDSATPQTGGNGNLIIAIVVLGIIVIAGLYFLTGGGGGGGSQGSNSGGTPSLYQGTVAVKLTDPPQVPVGTSALVVSYSSVSVHMSGTAGSGWISSSASGSVNLMALVNVSQVVGLVKVPTGSNVNIIRFNVSSAKITINGTTYNVTVPNNQLQANLQQSATVNGTTTVLVDLVPTIVTIYTNSSMVFILIPSLRAVASGSAPADANASISVGERENVNSTEHAYLQRTRPNVTITGATLSRSAGNVTNFALTVKDNSNSSVNLLHVGFVGNVSAAVSQAGITADINYTINRTISILEKVCGSTSNCLTASAGASGSAGGSAGGTGINVTKAIEACAAVGIPAVNTRQCGAYCIADPTACGITQAQVNALANVNQTEINNILALTTRFNVSITAFTYANGSINYASLTSVLRQKVLLTLQKEAVNFTRMQRQHSGVILFTIGTDGALTPVSTTQGGMNYTLQSGQSATFSYTGQIDFADNRMLVSPVPGQQYRVGVQGAQSIYFTNITATGH